MVKNIASSLVDPASTKAEKLNDQRGCSTLLHGAPLCLPALARAASNNNVMHCGFASEAWCTQHMRQKSHTDS